MSKTKSVKRRFAVWIASVAGMIVGTPVWLGLLHSRHIDARDSILIGGLIVLLALLSCIALLLKTTPDNAMRLRLGTSYAIILITTILFNACAIVSLSTGPFLQTKDNDPSPGVFQSSSLRWQITNAALAVACAIAILTLLKRFNQSPWWVVLFAWNPLVLLATAIMTHHGNPSVHHLLTISM